MNNSSIDIFNTPLRKIMLSLMNKTVQPIQASKTHSFNVAYPNKASNLDFNPNPGPATYNLRIEQKKNRIKLFSHNQSSFSASQRQPLIAKQNSSLGPGSFEPKKVYSTSVVIGKSLRPPLAIPSSAPLPGKYEYQSKLIETQGIKFKGSSFDPITKEIHSRPGPGTHEIEQKNVGPKFLFPKSQRYDFTKQSIGIPGPIYEIELKTSTPAFSFGKQQRR